MAEEEVKYNITIKRGSMEFTVARNEVISCLETPDGITFKIVGGIRIDIEDMNMPSSIKQRVCLADTTFKKGNLVVNLNDYINPVLLNS